MDTLSTAPPTTPFCHTKRMFHCNYGCNANSKNILTGMKTNTLLVQNNAIKVSATYEWEKAWKQCSWYVELQKKSLNRVLFLASVVVSMAQLCESESGLTNHTFVTFSCFSCLKIHATWTRRDVNMSGSQTVGSVMLPKELTTSEWLCLQQLVCACVWDGTGSRGSSPAGTNTHTHTN